MALTEMQSATGRTGDTGGGTLQPTQEIRFGVVLYGGVSLAIYMYGVVQELFSLVQATAPAGGRTDGDDGGGLETGTALRFSDSELQSMGASPVYRRLARMLSHAEAPDMEAASSDVRTRFVVDILSGTSAGGINGIALAMALANGTDLSQLGQVWLREAHVSRLLNVEASYKDDTAHGEELTYTAPPRSLLNSARMLQRLRRAFSALATPAPEGPYVNEVDLAVTATDVWGRKVQVRLADGTAVERRHAASFRFRYRRLHSQGTQNDFTAENVPFLAFTARATSAFPMAFQPMKLLFAVKPPPAGHASAELAEPPTWARSFYADYARTDNTTFPGRPFADGGVLDNKPFSLATDALQHRRADLPVDRRLLYVEPDPWNQATEPTRKDEDEPGPLAVAKAAVLDIRGAEPIADDVCRIEARNAAILRMRDTLLAVDPHLGWSDPNPSVLPEEPLYHELRVAETVDAITDLLAAAAPQASASDAPGPSGVPSTTGPLEEADERVEAVRDLVRAWLGSGAMTTEAFVHRYRLRYELRRSAFVQERLNDLARHDDRGRAARRGAGLPERPGDMDQFRAGVRQLRRAVAAEHAVLVEVLDGLRPSVAGRHEDGSADVRPLERQAEAPDVAALHAAVAETAARLAVDLDDVAGQPSVARRREAAAALVRDLPSDAFRRLQGALEAYLTASFRRADQARDRALTAIGGVPDELRRAVEAYRERYERYDRVLLPLIHGTNFGETNPVVVTRVSPRDSSWRTDGTPERDGPVPELFGAGYGHFAAFFREDWRRLDMVSGRLDAAERLIRSLLPEGDDAKVDELIEDAHRGILEQEMGEGGLLRPALRTENASESADGLKRETPEMNALRSRGEHLQWFLALRAMAPRTLGTREWVDLGRHALPVAEALLATVPLDGKRTAGAVLFAGAALKHVDILGERWALAFGRRLGDAVIDVRDNAQDRVGDVAADLRRSAEDVAADLRTSAEDVLDAPRRLVGWAGRKLGL